MTERRQFLRQLAAGVSTLALAGCDRLTSSQHMAEVLGFVETFTRLAQDSLLGDGLAKEFPESAISPDFRANGTTAPDSQAYLDHAAAAFSDWSLEIGGLVAHPLKLTLAELRAAPARTQITRHDCVEGWSGIAKWRGARLGPLIARAMPHPSARYLVFHCADTLELTLDGTGDYYETIALKDAFHPQTILAYDMNDQPLPVAHGAPVRLRLERKLGYKMAKYVMRIEAVESFADIGRGRGGYWEDRGYDWHGGI